MFLNKLTIILFKFVEQTLFIILFPYGTAMEFHCHFMFLAVFSSWILIPFNFDMCAFIWSLRVQQKHVWWFGEVRELSGLYYCAVGLDFWENGGLRSRNECIPCNLEFIYFDQVGIDYLKFMLRRVFWSKHGMWNSFNIPFLVDIFMLCMCEHVSVYSIAEMCQINVENHVGVGKHVSM